LTFSLRSSQIAELVMVPDHFFLSLDAPRGGKKVVIDKQVPLLLLLFSLAQRIPQGCSFTFEGPLLILA